MTKDETFRSSEAGLLMKIIGFAPIERVVAAVLQFAANQQLHGRAAGVFPMANEDLGDDLEGMFGGRVTQKHMKDVMVKVARAMAEQEKANGNEGELGRMDSASAAPAGVWG
jgi:5'-hydroxyaverantin dehydrogenase